MPSLVERLLRDPVHDLWRQSLEHPLVRGLGDGTLAPSHFRYFIQQDAVYLLDFSRVLAMAAARAASRSDERTLLKHALSVHEVEQALHEDLAPRLGLEAAVLTGTPPGAVTTAYTDHLLRHAWASSAATVMAAVLPCYWLYRDVGQALAGDLPAHEEYQAWILTYAGDTYGEAVAEVLEMEERLVADAGADERPASARAFSASLRYEWLFWEQAWREGALPLQGFDPSAQ